MSNETFIEAFHNDLVAKLGAGTFKITPDKFIAHFANGKSVEVPLDDIVVAHDVGAVPLLVDWTAKRAKQ